MLMQSTQALRSVKVSKGKSKAVKSDTDDSSSDTDANTDDESTDSDMMEMVAILVKGFKKMKFRRNRKQGKSSEEVLQC